MGGRLSSGCWALMWSVTILARKFPQHSGRLSHDRAFSLEGIWGRKDVDVGSPAHGGLCTFFCWALKGRKDLSCRGKWERAMEVFLSAFLSGPRLQPSKGKSLRLGSHAQNKLFLPYVSSFGGHMICQKTLVQLK